MAASAGTTQETFTVIVSGTTFVLSRAQIRRDAPNYFTSYFLDDSGDRIREYLELSRDPGTFTLLLRYLNGYQVIPLQPAILPPSTNASVALADLMADAEFFRLDDLFQACKAEKEPRYAVITGYLRVDPYSYFLVDDLEDVIPRCTYEVLDSKVAQSARGTLISLTEETSNNPLYFVVSGWTHKLIEKLLDARGISVSRWELVGWMPTGTIKETREVIVLIKLWM